MIHINKDTCRNCSACFDVCPSLVIDSKEMEGKKDVFIRFPDFCNTCGHCLAVCPHDALSLEGMPVETLRKIPEKQVDPEALKMLILSRRSIRDYRDQPVPEKVLNELIEVATHAGTASNLQSVHFICITDRRLLDRLEETVIDVMWNSGLKYFGGKGGLRSRVISRSFGPEMAPRMERTSRLITTRRAENRVKGMVFRRAPVLVLAHDEKNGLMGPINCAIAMRNMELLAHAMGLGSCWAGYLINAADRKPAVINKMAGISRSRRIYGALMLGYPKTKYLKLIPRAGRELKHF